jgi:transcription termination factor Rho
MRMLDLVCPPGKGQRCLIVSPPAGRQDRAAAITRAIERNHPEAVLLVLLIDERPEEVTDRRRMVEGRSCRRPSTSRRQSRPGGRNHHREGPGTTFQR